MIFSIRLFNLDSPIPWAITFQDPASLRTSEAFYFHDFFIFFLLVILVIVFWVLLVTVIAAYRNTMSIVSLRHHTSLEIVWTLIPSMVVLLVAVPSFRLLYLCDEILDPSVTLKVIGSQWYWSYEITPFMDNVNEIWAASFDSFISPDDVLSEGELRLLSVDSSLVLPYDTNIRVVVTASDVLHSWAVPSFGLKLDCIPGRLNSTFLNIDRIGTFFGQCSELCGTFHGFMPITVNSVTTEDFLAYMSLDGKIVN